MSKAINHIIALKRHWAALQASVPAAEFASRRSLQFKDLKQVLTDAHFSLEEASAALEQLGSMGLSQSELAEVSTCVNTLPSAETVISRRPLQDYTNLHMYLTQELSELLSSEQSLDVKLNGLIDHAIRLGLRTPSEPTVKHILAIALVRDSAKQGTPGALFHLYKQTKHMVKHAVTTAP